MEQLEQSQKHKCLSCGTEFEGNFCPNCGQSKKVGRLSTKRVLTELIPDIYSLDNRFLRTCFDLFRRPGKMILDYLQGNRVRYYKPISLLFLLASAYIIVQHFCGIDTEHPFTLDQLYTIEINVSKIEWCTVGSYWDRLFRIIYELYWNEAWNTLISITLLIYPLKLAFRKTEMGKTLNLAEFFFIMLFINCQEFIVKIIQTLLNYLCSFSIYTEGLFDDSNVSIVWFLFSIWALMQIFGTGKRRTLFNYIKAHVLMYILIGILSTLIILPVAYISSNHQDGTLNRVIEEIRSREDSTKVESQNPDSVQLSIRDLVNEILED